MQMDATGWIASILISAAAYGVLIVAGRWIFAIGYHGK
jgi:hypothetical protein